MSKKNFENSSKIKRFQSQGWERAENRKFKIQNLKAVPANFQTRNPGFWPGQRTRNFFEMGFGNVGIPNFFENPILEPHLISIM